MTVVMDDGSWCAVRAYQLCPSKAVHLPPCSVADRSTNLKAVAEFGIDPEVRCCCLLI